MGTIPQEIIQKIKDYTPRDKDMKSPTVVHIKSLLYDYNYDYEEIYNLFDEWDELDRLHGLDEPAVFNMPLKNEPFYKYILRIYKTKKEPRYIPNNNYNPSDTNSDSD